MCYQSDDTALTNKRRCACAGPSATAGRPGHVTNFFDRWLAYCRGATEAVFKFPPFLLQIGLQFHPIRPNLVGNVPILVLWFQVDLDWLVNWLKLGSNFSIIGSFSWWIQSICYKINWINRSPIQQNWIKLFKLDGNETKSVKNWSWIDETKLKIGINRWPIQWNWMREKNFD